MCSVHTKNSIIRLPDNTQTGAHVIRAVYPVSNNPELLSHPFTEPGNFNLKQVDVSQHQAVCLYEFSKVLDYWCTEPYQRTIKIFMTKEEPPMRDGCQGWKVWFQFGMPLPMPSEQTGPACSLCTTWCPAAWPGPQISSPCFPSPHFLTWETWPHLKDKILKQKANL